MKSEITVFNELVRKIFGKFILTFIFIISMVSPTFALLVVDSEQTCQNSAGGISNYIFLRTKQVAMISDSTSRTANCSVLFP